MADLSDVRDTVAALTAQLSADLTATWEKILTEQAELLTRWPTGTAHSRQRTLTVLERAVRALMADTRTVLTLAVPQVLDAAHTAGAAGALADVQAALGAAQLSPAVLLRAAGDDLGDLLAATRHVEDTTKALVRLMAREHVQDALLTGRTALVAGRNLARDLAGAGITAITYRDGSRHGLAEYAQTVLRTRTADTYQQAALDTYAAAGVGYVELLDNPSCGLTRHEDPQKANGLILPIAQAAQYRLSHPNCVRASSPRPDITSEAEAGTARRSTTDAQDATQSEVERAREDAASARAGGRGRALSSRTARGPSGALLPRAGAAPSAAAARHVTRTAGDTPAGAVRAARRAAVRRAGG